TNNVPPAVRISNAPQNAAPNQSVEFETSGFDSDGDVLAYHWDFGDNSISANVDRLQHAWTDPGDYVVRVEVSDMKGGIDSDYVVVRVGSPSTYQISGRVTDASGNPIQGVLVHNGMADAA